MNTRAHAHMHIHTYICQIVFSGASLLLSRSGRQRHRSLEQLPTFPLAQIVVVPESAAQDWKGLSDELAVIRALWRCRSYYFVPVMCFSCAGVYKCACAHAAELGCVLSQPIVCIIDVCGLRMGFRALAPEGSRVVYGPGMSVRLPIYWHYDSRARESRTAAPRHVPLFTYFALTAGFDATQAPQNCKARQVRQVKNVLA
jgi:hypothetical protein